MRLDETALARAGLDVGRFAYDREVQQVGIVHFGIGAFHRAHQAWYTDLAMDGGDRNWAITGVSLRSPTVAEQLNPQQSLFSLTERSGAGDRLRLIGAVRNVLVANGGAKAVIAALAAPSTHIASFTVTEKGYCRAADGTLEHGLAGPESLYRFVAEGLRRRHDAGLPGLTLLCCDNLAANGRQLEALMRQYLERHDPVLTRWFEGECTCPSAMVDRIVPATTAADLARAEEVLGCRDEAAVVTEPFSQWVIEDRFAGPRPRWEQAGAQPVADVEPFETAKLRMLNGAHSLLAYCGLRRGHAFIHEAIADPALRALAERLMTEEATPTIAAAPGQDLLGYAAQLLDRFANPALKHRLSQIATDGSEKIPQRWLETLEANRRMGRQCPAILAGLQAWLSHVSGANGPVEDPMASSFTELWRALDLTGVAQALFGERGTFGAVWRASETDLAAIALPD